VRLGIPKTSYDPACLELAKHFYPNASEKFLDDLAVMFQFWVEGCCMEATPVGELCSHCGETHSHE
jgi:hypothetical protein